MAAENVYSDKPQEICPGWNKYLWSLKQVCEECWKHNFLGFRFFFIFMFLKETDDSCLFS